MRGRARCSRAVVWSLVALTLVSVACATDKRTYYWSSHQRDLSRVHRDDPETAKKFEATLLSIIKKSDASGRRAPPGTLAEYGYFLFQRGEMESAIYYFEREAREWPESSALMEGMIGRARGGSGS